MVSAKHLPLVLLGTAALAIPAAPAIGAPPIAYARESGTKFDLHLTNPNGSGTVLVYSSPAKSSIGQVEMNPAANQLAVVESRSTGFKLINYTAAGVRTSVVPVDDGCRVQGLDFHPSDGSLLVSRWCESANTLEVKRYANGAYDSSPIVSFGDPAVNAIGSVRWLADGSGFLIAYTNVSTGARIQRHRFSNPSAPVTIVSFSGLAIPGFDVARCSVSPDCSKLLYTDQSGGIHQVTFDDFGGTDQGVIASGYDAHYSPDNSEYLYRATVKGGFQLMIGGANPRTLGAKGTYLGKDWRP